MTLKTKITKARADLVFDHPFFGAILLRLRMVEDPEIGTAATDGYAIYYDPKFIGVLTAAQINGLLAHEVLHVALLHHLRMGNRNPEVWNIAGDYVINKTLLDAGFQLPPDGCVDYHGLYTGMSAETIYALLMKDPKVQEQIAEGGGQVEVKGQKSFDKLLPPPKDKSLVAEQDAKELAQTGLIAGKKAGKIPGNLEAMILGTQQPQVAWADELREVLTSRAAGEQTWTRPNPRLQEIAYLPYTRPTPAGELVLLIDSSGSVSNAELEAYSSELKPIMLDNCITKLTVIYFDSVVNHVDEFTDVQDIEMNVKGRGGTNFKAAFDYVEENLTGYNAIIVFTDGGDRVPDEAPQVPVIWCQTGTYNFDPHFGRVIKLEF